MKRFVRPLEACAPVRVWRIECNPGEESQVDFGLGAPIVDKSGKRRRTWVLRVVPSFPRKGYSEAVLHQDTETFLRAAAAPPRQSLFTCQHRTAREIGPSVLIGIRFSASAALQHNASCLKTFGPECGRKAKQLKELV